MKARGQKSQFSNFSVNWEKFGNAIQAFQKSQFSISFMNWAKLGNKVYRPPDQQFKIKMLNLWMSWKNVCPNLSFTVENNMGHSHKRGWSHFKLNTNV